MKILPLPSQERLRELLNYDPGTGVFTWRTRRIGRAKQGSVAGSLKADGYVHICIDGQIYRAHRLAWKYMNGVDPAGLIDHKFRGRADNTEQNLRDVTQRVNSQNLRVARRGKKSCNLLGVHFYKSSGRWTAHITVNGKTKYLGTFASPEIAHQAYVAAKRQLHEGNTL